jgi:SagB-type dehydrogenase family enzyme
VECEFRVGETDTFELYVEGRVWAEMSTKWMTFLPDIEVPFPYKLSRFAHMTYGEERWWLKTPLSRAAIQVHEGLLLKLIQDLDRDEHLVDEAVARLFGVMLANANLLDTQDEVYKAWPAADLVYLQAEQNFFLQPPTSLPPIKPPMSEEIVTLPDIPSDQWMDQSLADVVTQRRTLYQYGESPLTIEQVSEFLLRTLKAHAYLNGEYYDSTVRSYASAGAAYELEAYLFIEQCTGITSGFYHYNPGSHTLERLPFAEDMRDAWITESKQATNRQIESVQILFFFTMRMGRIRWKYRPLALTYTNLGVVYHAFYLTATAMNLSPCALGGWNAAWFSKQTGIPLSEEALVGQFLLGS